MELITKLFDNRFHVLDILQDSKKFHSMVLLKTKSVNPQSYCD